MMILCAKLFSNPNMQDAIIARQDSGTDKHTHRQVKLYMLFCISWRGHKKFSCSLVAVAQKVMKDPLNVELVKSKAQSSFLLSFNLHGAGGIQFPNLCCDNFSNNLTRMPLLFSLILPFSSKPDCVIALWLYQYQTSSCNYHKVHLLPKDMGSFFSF